MKSGRCLAVAATVLLLAGCRIELYSGLPEEDANQMLAILMQHHIDADKQRGEGGITLRVEQAQFINAVELLRLNGFPHRKYTTAEMMFPPNQLVVSPSEEQQKILYLKEQRIEGMLSQMEG
ncbi:Yop proteins translocation lipoprotein J [Sodalis praecaptivus]